MLNLRNRVSKSPLGIMSFVLLATSIIAAPVAFSETLTWRTLGQRWAVTVDSSGAATAIYDLSYPAYIDPLPLATLGESKLSAKQIISVLLKAKTGNFDDDRKVDEVVGELSQRSSDEIKETVFPERWWTTVKWRDQQSSNARAPEVFTLADLDLEAMAKKKKKMSEKLSEVRRLWSELKESNPELGDDVFSQLSLQAKSGSQSYDLVWNPSALGFSRIKKIADLKNSKWGFLEAMKWELLDQALNSSFGLGRSSHRQRHS